MEMQLFRRRSKPQSNSLGGAAGVLSLFFMSPSRDLRVYAARNVFGILTHRQIR
jgi:hypothetical protein